MTSTTSLRVLGRRALGATVISAAAVVGLFASSAHAIAPLPSPHPSPLTTVSTSVVRTAPVPNAFPNPDVLVARVSIAPNAGTISIEPNPSPHPIPGRAH